MRMDSTAADPDFQAIFAVLPDPVLILDRDLRIAAANRKFEEAASSPQVDLLGRSIFELFPEDGDGSIAADIHGPRNLRASLERVLHLGVADMLPFQRFPDRKQRLGSGGKGERFWSVSHTPVPGPEGMVIFIVHSVKDVTEYVQSRRIGGEGVWVGPDQSRAEEFEAGIFIQTRRLAEENRSLEASIRELVRLEIESKLAVRRKQVLLASIGRKFRAPLNALMDSLDGLRAPRPNASNQDFQQGAETAATQGLELVGLANRLQDILQLDAVKADAVFQAVDLAAVTSSLAAGFRAHAGISGADLEVDCRRLPFPVQVDREMWEKILINLLTNAFNSTRKGRVRLQLEDAEDAAILEVSDTGTGIPEAALAGIFDGPREDGTHLGLALVKRLVQVHGGAVRIDSTVGRGTEVTIRLPYYRVGEAASEQRTAAQPRPQAWVNASAIRNGKVHAGKPASESRILVADSGPETREYARWLLRGLWEVQTVATSREAIDLCLENPPDLILCEASLPDLSGPVLVKALRANPRTRSLPILLVSGKPGSEADLEALETGADGSLHKPYSAKELIASVDAHLRLAALRRQDEEERLAGIQRSLESDKMDQVGRLAAGVAHDFNNLLTAVNGYAELALGMTPDTGLQQCLSEIREAGSKAAETAKLLLAYGQKQVTVPRPMSLDELVLDLQPKLRTLFLGSVNLVIRLDPDLAPIVADRPQMIQMIMSLALNARDAMPDGGTFTFGISNGHGEGGPPEGPDSGEAPGFVCLTFKDTGMGIDPALIDRIFEPYYTSHPLSATKGKGLGLSSVLGIVRQHHGHIRVRSFPGLGSTFEILLPAAEGAPKRPGGSTAQESGAALSANSPENPEAERHGDSIDLNHGRAS